MAELDGMRQGERFKASKTPTSATSEQGRHDTPSSWSTDMSPTSVKNHNFEEDHFPHHKKSSVLTKVKEKAKKWRQSLIRKKHCDHTPSWGVALEDDEVDQDPEYLGAPMYESELAPYSCKEHVRQHPRADPVVSEKHVLGTMTNSQADEEKTKSPPSPAEKMIAEGGKDPSSTSTTVEDRSEKPPCPSTETMAEEKEIAPGLDEGKIADDEVTQNPPIPKNTIAEDEKDPSSTSTIVVDRSEKSPCPSAETMAEEKEIPPGLDEGKIADDEVTQNPPIPRNTISDHGKGEIPSSERTITETVTEKLTPAFATISEATHTIISNIQGLSFSDPLEDAVRGDAGSGDRTWDKGVSLKEYIRNKLEPGEDEKALSQVISDTISSRKNPGDKGVVEKVKEAVASLRQSKEVPVSLKSSNSSNHIPLSTNAHEGELMKKIKGGYCKLIDQGDIHLQN